MWYFLSLLSGFFFATADAFSKKESRISSPMIIAWVREAYAIPFMLPLLLSIDIPSLDSVFWISVILCVLIDFLTTYLYMYAIRIAPLSLTVPYLGLTPIFLLVIPRIILGETLSVTGMIGVVLVSIGTYILQLDRAKYGIFEPWLAIFKNKGSFFMLIVAICYSVTSTLGKLAIQHSNPITMSIVYFSLLAVTFTPFALREAKKQNIRIDKRAKSYFSIGLAMALMAITHFTAISHVQVAYMISIKRLSLLFAILYGWILFGEKNVRERLTGGIVIIAGATLIAFA